MGWQTCHSSCIVRSRYLVRRGCFIHGQSLLSRFGLYYKADNLEDLKEKMNYMISNPKVLENMGNKARAFALKHNYSDYCSKLMDIILK